MSTVSTYMPRLLCLALALAFVACDNSDETQDEHHLEAFGVALVSGADTLVRAEGGQAADVSGLLSLQVNQARTLALHFLDDEGHWFRPEPDPDGEHTCAVDHNGSVQVEIDSLNWMVTLTGLQADSSSLRVRVLHLGHDDFVSPDLPLVIEP